MAAPAQNAPKYRHYKPKNLGVVRIDGRELGVALVSGELDDRGRAQAAIEVVV